MNYYSVCIVSLVTPLSMYVWNLYQSINGTKNETFESYKKLPAIWGNICGIIDSEIARIDRIKAIAEKRQMEIIARNASLNRRK